MLMYNLLEYSQNCSMISGSVWNYYKDEIDDVDNKKNERRPARSALLPPNRDGFQPLQPPIPSLNTEVTSLLNILVMFRGLLICL